MATRKWTEKQIREAARHSGEKHYVDALLDTMQEMFPVKVKGEVDPCFHLMKQVWFDAYPIMEKKFSGAHAKCINDIINDTKTVMTNRGKEITCDGIINSFKYVIAYVKRERHFCDGKPLTTWNQQYLSIVHEIANGKAKPLSTREKINQM